jgi:hypothetical protein
LNEDTIDFFLTGSQHQVALVTSGNAAETSGMFVQWFTQNVGQIVTYLSTPTVGGDEVGG